MPPFPAKPTAQYYASPTGTPVGDGSQERPWDLKTALSAKATVKPGSTLWLRGGAYGTGGPTVFNSSLVGTRDAPVAVRQFRGETATINGGIQANGAFTTFWGFTITNTNPERTTAGINRPAGLSLLGPGHRAINLVIHNAGHPGVGFWTPESATDDSELYGTIIYHNGLHDDSGKFAADGKPLIWTRGSGVYAQNRHGTRYLLDNIIFRNYNIGLKVYTENGYIDGFHIEGNVLFDGVDWNLAVQGGIHQAQRLRIINNYLFRRPHDPRRNAALGTRNAVHQDVIVQGNYIAGSAQSYQEGALGLFNWSRATVTGNTIIGSSALVSWLPHASSKEVTWNNNDYYGTEPARAFLLKPPGSHSSDLAAWKTATGFDLDSRFVASLPAKNRIEVRPNKYDSGRANIVIYNWERKSQVAVDVSGVMKQGARYLVRDVQNYFGPPVASGTFAGTPITLPMDNLPAAKVLGPFSHSEYFDPSSHTPLDFACFVITSDE